MARMAAADPEGDEFGAAEQLSELPFFWQKSNDCQ
jgi:hypothetical protein